jgi:serine/threonine-protein kinase RsbW
VQIRKLFEKSFDSTLECVDEAELAVGAAAKELGFGEVNQQRIRLATREAMVNAVAHGNRFDVSKKVRFQLSEGANGSLVVDIEDEGPGFEEKSVPDPLDEANLEYPSGRGLLIMRTFMDEVAIGGPGTSGTHLRMVKFPRTKPVRSENSMNA